MYWICGTCAAGLITILCQFFLLGGLFFFAAQQWSRRAMFIVLNGKCPLTFLMAVSSYFRHCHNTFCVNFKFIKVYFWTLAYKYCHAKIHAAGQTGCCFWPSFLCHESPLQLQFFHSWPQRRYGDNEIQWRKHEKLSQANSTQWIFNRNIKRSSQTRSEGEVSLSPCCLSWSLGYSKLPFDKTTALRVLCRRSSTKHSVFGRLCYSRAHIWRKLGVGNLLMN